MSKRHYPPVVLNLPTELEKRIQERGFIDFPAAWEIAKFYPITRHNPECSFRESNGAVLCDCEILKWHQPEKKSEVAEHLKGKLIPILYKREVTRGGEPITFRSVECPVEVKNENR